MSTSDWKWYLQRDNKEYGPLSHQELLILAGLGKVQRSDRLRTNSYPSWVPAALIPGLLAPPLNAPRPTLASFAEPAMTRLMSATLRVKRNIRSLLLGASLRARRSIRTLLRSIDTGSLRTKLPMIGCSVACAVLVVIAIGARTSEESLAIGVPEIAKMEKARAPSFDDMAAAPRKRPAPVIPASYSPIPKSFELSKPENNPSLTAGDDLTAETVPLPPRKVSVDAPLRNTDTKEGARSVQRRLRDLGYLAANADGSWGPQSRLALKQFLRRANITNNGWDRRAERILFSSSAPQAAPYVRDPIVENLF